MDSLGKKITTTHKKATSLLLARNFSEADTVLSGLTDKYPFYSPAWDLRAFIRVAKSDIEGALEMTRRALDYYQDSPDQLCNHAGMLAMADRPEEAEALFKQALKAQADHRKTLDGLDRITNGKGFAGPGGWFDMNGLLECLGVSAKPTDDLNFMLPIVVWGNDFIHAFMEYSIRFHLAPGNLPFLKEKARVKYTIYTTRADAPKLTAYPTWKLLGKLAELELVLIEDIYSGKREGFSKYDCALACHQDSISKARKENSLLILVTPDTILADGCLKGLYGLARQGKKYVYDGALRTSKEPFLKHAKQLVDAKGAITMTAREMVSLTGSMIHDASKATFWDAETINTWPSVLLWKAENGTLLQYCFHMHPLLITPTDIPQDIQISLDGDAAQSFMRDYRLDDLHVVEDSNELYYTEVTAQDEHPNRLTPGRFDIPTVAKWSKHHTNSFNRLFGAHCVKHHSNALDAKTEQIMSESTAIIAEILCRE